MTSDLPDPRKGIYIFCSGRKGSGKSVVCRAWFDAYPFDRIIIDPTHDVAADLRQDGVPFTELRSGLDLPARLPAYRPGQPQTYVHSPDMGSETALDDMDRVVGLALGRDPTYLWVDEYGELTTAHQTPPNMRRVLHHGRHDHLSLCLACPRPVDVNPLGISQADLVYMFFTANPDDRARIAKNIGLDTAEVDDINREIGQQGAFWHMLHDHRQNVTSIMPPLPRARRGRPLPPIGMPGELVAASEADELTTATATARRRRK